MRASATSRTSSAAHYASAQAKPNADKADEASPFALLLDVAAAPAQKDTSNSADTPPDGQPIADPGPDDNATAGQVAAQVPAKPTGKKEKIDPPQDQNQAGEAASDVADDSQSSAVLLQLLQMQAAPPQPQTQAATTPAPLDDKAGGIPIGQIDAAAGAPKTAPGVAMDPAAPGGPADQPPPVESAPPAGKPAPLMAAQTPPPAESDDDSLDTEAGMSAAQDIQSSAPQPQSQPQSQLLAKPAAPAKTMAKSDVVKPDTVKTAAAAKPSQTVAQPADTGETDAAQDIPDDAAIQAAAAPVNPAKDGEAKLDAALPKGAASKIRPAAQEAISKANSGKSDTDKPDVQPADPRVALTDDVSTPSAKPASQPPQQQPANFSLAIGSAAPTQATQPGSQPVLAQHVQVAAAHAAPNLPQLAVAIAAKSLSGAKQFDIRLDPPELGRVDVRLSIDATGKASAHLSADQPQTLSLLQKDAPVLTRALREAGLDVSQDGLNFSLRQQADTGNGNAAGNGRRGSSRNFGLTATASIEPTTASAAYRSVANGRLDIRV